MSGGSRPPDTGPLASRISSPRPWGSSTGERARLIGLVLPELQNPIFPALAEVIGGALAQRGFTPVLCTRTTGGLSEADYVGMLLDQHVSGMVFFGGHCAEQAAPHDHYRLLRSRGVPTVLMNAAIDNLDFPRVSTDDVTAAGQAYTHLASLGHQRIGLVLGPEDHVPSRRKLAGFTAHARRAPENSPVEHALFSLEGGQAATDPPLTTVRQPIESMGKAAVALLVNQIENTDVYPEELLFEPELVVRGSTGRPGTGTAVGALPPFCTQSALGLEPAIFSTRRHGHPGA